MLYLFFRERLRMVVAVPDSTLEQHRVLGYHGYCRPKIRQSNVTDVHLNMY